MMITTKFNKRKHLFKEIVKIPELCFKERTRKVQFSAFSLQFVLLLKFFRCMNVESLFFFNI